MYYIRSLKLHTQYKKIASNFCLFCVNLFQTSGQNSMKKHAADVQLCKIWEDVQCV